MRFQGTSALRAVIDFLLPWQASEAKSASAEAQGNLQFCDLEVAALSNPRRTVFNQGDELTNLVHRYLITMHDLQKIQSSSPTMGMLADMREKGAHREVKNKVLQARRQTGEFTLTV